MACYYSIGSYMYLIVYLQMKCRYILQLYIRHILTLFRILGANKATISALIVLLLAKIEQGY